MKKDKVLTEGADVRLSNPLRFGSDIATYANAMRSFLRIDRGQRWRLYDLYDDCLLDPHLLSVVEKRRNNILTSPMTYILKDGTTPEYAARTVETPWFRDMLSDALDSVFFGFSLLEMWTDEEGEIQYKMVPRKHVDPVLKIIKRMQSDIHGEPWDAFAGLVFIGSERGGGLMASAVPYVLYKREAMGEWAQYCELYGIPTRVYKYDSADTETRQQLLQDAAAQGGKCVYIQPSTAEMQLLESGSKGSSAQLYEALATRCNAEISKLILGNTLTTEASSTGTQALGTVQSKGEEALFKADKGMLEDFLNHTVRPLLTSLGAIKDDGGEFRFGDTEQLSKREQMEMAKSLYDMGLPLSASELYARFGFSAPMSDEDAVVKAADSVQDGGDMQDGDDTEEGEIAGEDNG